MYVINMCVDKHSRRCIDGSIVGLTKCVGYCRYKGHMGFLTKKLRQQHNCIKKECVFYVPKTTVKTEDKVDMPCLQRYVDLANEKAASFEGVRFLKAVQNDDGSYTLFYVSIAEYPLDTLKEEVEKKAGLVHFARLDYDYETCVKLIFL